jgi:hypothetical protein
MAAEMKCRAASRSMALVRLGPPLPPAPVWRCYQPAIIEGVEDMRYDQVIKVAQDLPALQTT